MFRFSPSQLHTLLECPRCMWLKYRAGIERPRGIFPGLPGAIDSLLQQATAKMAGKQKPSWLLPQLKQGVIRKGSKRFVTRGEHWELTGNVDDLILLNDDSVILLDYKTARQAHSQKNSETYYRLQLDCYALLLEANNLKSAETAYLVYTTPDYLLNFAYNTSFGINFKVTHTPILVSAERAREAINKGVEICMADNPPAAAANCEYCQYAEKRTQKKV